LPVLLLLLGGVNGRNPLRFPLPAGAVVLRWVGTLFDPRPLPLFGDALGGVKGRKLLRFPFGADGFMLRCVWTLPGAGERVLPLFCGVPGRVFDGVNGR
jgi:hypothetical protein